MGQCLYRGTAVTQPGICREVGFRIKSLRMDCGLTQERLANDIGMTQSYLAEIESGKRNVSLSNIARIARGLNVSLSELFEGICLNGNDFGKDAR